MVDYVSCKAGERRGLGETPKPILTKEAKKRGVKIVNRVTAFDLITDHGISGAVGVHGREDKIVTFSAKAAHEMRARSEELIQDPYEELRCSTFHARFSSPGQSLKPSGLSSSY